MPVRLTVPLYAYRYAYIVRLNHCYVFFPRKVATSPQTFANALLFLQTSRTLPLELSCLLLVSEHLLDIAEQTAQRLLFSL